MELTPEGRDLTHDLQQLESRVKILEFEVGEAEKGDVESEASARSAKLPESEAAMDDEVIDPLGLYDAMAVASEAGIIVEKDEDANEDDGSYLKRVMEQTGEKEETRLLEWLKNALRTHYRMGTLLFNHICKASGGNQIDQQAFRTWSNENQDLGKEVNWVNTCITFMANHLPVGRSKFIDLFQQFVQSEWREVPDPGTGRPYYINEWKEQPTTWEKPTIEAFFRNRPFLAQTVGANKRGGGRRSHSYRTRRKTLKKTRKNKKKRTYKKQINTNKIRSKNQRRPLKSKKNKYTRKSKPRRTSRRNRPQRVTRK